MSGMTPPEHRDTHTERDRQVIVTDGGRRDTGAGVIVAVILGVLALILIGVFAFGNGGGNVNNPPADSGDTTVNNEVEQAPEETAPAETAPAETAPADGGTTTG